MILDEDKSVKKTEAGQRKIKSWVRGGMGVWQGPAAGDSGLSLESHKRVSLVWQEWARHREECLEAGPWLQVQETVNWEQTSRLCM